MMEKDDLNLLYPADMPPSFSISVVYQSEQVFVIEKPPGLSFHQKEDTPGVVQTFREGVDAGLFGESGEVYPVHRLDTVTSGLMILARNQDTARELSQAMQQHEVEKLYVALSVKKPQKKQGWVIGDMERSRRGTWKLTRDLRNPAMTRFRSFSIPKHRPGLRMFLLKPETGKTHQLRVAMKSLGAPILGDPLYGLAIEAAKEERTYLHACALRFSIGTEQISVCSVPSVGTEFTSDSFCQVWHELGDLWSFWQKP